MKPCGHCHRYIERFATRCPFCDTVARDDFAPGSRLAWISLAFGLTACVEPANDGGGSSETTEGMTGNATAVSASSTNGGTTQGYTSSSSTTTPGTTDSNEETRGATVDTNDTIDDADVGEGSTYAGPDEDTSTWGESTTVPPDTADSSGSTTATSESTTFDGDTDTDGNGSTGAIGSSEG